jgi:hypothetical protein
MPYFNNDKVNLLFIHIPKTGGTSIENYFSKKYNIPLNKNSLYSEMAVDNNVSLQHQSYEYIINNHTKYKIDLNNLNILAVVRNPYHRIVSEMFYHNIISINCKPDQVFWELRKCLYDYKKNNSIYDNHIRPQYYFITYNDTIPDNIKILKTEKLTEMMRQNNYIDFNFHHNKTNSDIDYIKLLTKDSIRLINEMYKKDFELFGYEMIVPK